MITLEQIRQKVVEAIKQSKLTQTELARRLGIGQQTISEYIRGKSLPALDTFANLCAVLDLDANEILCTEEYDKNNRYCSECGKIINNLPANWQQCSECNKKQFHSKK